MRGIHKQCWLEGRVGQLWMGSTLVQDQYAHERQDLTLHQKIQKFSKLAIKRYRREFLHSFDDLLVPLAPHFTKPAEVAHLGLEIPHHVVLLLVWHLGQQVGGPEAQVTPRVS